MESLNTSSSTTATTASTTNRNAHLNNHFIIYDLRYSIYELRRSSASATGGMPVSFLQDHQILKRTGGTPVPLQHAGNLKSEIVNRKSQIFDGF
jgi:hypothetical protein